jgi:hypothetical protein
VDLAAPADVVRGVATPADVTAFFAVRILVGVLSGIPAASFMLAGLLLAGLLSIAVPLFGVFVRAFLVRAFFVGAFLVSARGLRDLVTRDFLVAARAPRAFALLVMA